MLTALLLVFGTSLAIAVGAIAAAIVPRHEPRFNPFPLDDHEQPAL